MAVAWREQPGDPSIVSTESERKDSFEHRVKNQTAVFQSGTFLLQKVETREGIKLKVDLWKSNKTVYMGGIRFIHHGVSVVGV